MLTRRSFVSATGTSLLLMPGLSWAQGQPPIEEFGFDEQAYPSFDAIGTDNLFGSLVPSQEAREKAERIIAGTPMGPRPIDIVYHLVTTYGESDPAAISQTPRRDAWNPLIVTFFATTNHRAVNDMVPWCAAFANWCLSRSGRTSSNSPASQSFLDYPRIYPRTDTPRQGDLAIFTCYYPHNNRTTGLGHVGFVHKPPAAAATHVEIAGGNQTQDGRSTICIARFPLGEKRSSRTIEGIRTPVISRLNCFLKVS